MEATDKQILDLLKQDGRMSYTDLARSLGMSTSAVHQRVRRLEERGVIVGYRALVDPAAENRTLTAFLYLTPMGAPELEEVASQLSDLTELSACYSVAGTESYLLVARVASPEALEQLAWEVRRRTGMSTRTQVVLTTKFER